MSAMDWSSSAAALPPAAAAEWSAAPSAPASTPLAAASSSPAAPAAASSSVSLSSLLAPSAQSTSDLEIERILKSRELGGETQVRVRWRGLHTETWVSRESLFWRGEAAVDLLAEFDEAVAKGYITAEGGWEEAEAVAAAAKQAYEGWMAMSSGGAAGTAAAGADAATPARAGTKRGRASKGGASRSRKKSAGSHKKKTPEELAANAAIRAAKKAAAAARGTSASAAKGRGKARARSSGTKRRRSGSLSSASSAADDFPSGGEDDDQQEDDHAADDSSSDDAAEAAALAAQGEYEVERIVGDVWDKGLHWFRVAWRGFSDYDNSWQRPEDLTGCAGILKEYWAEKKRKQKSVLAKRRAERKKENQRKAEAKKQKDRDALARTMGLAAFMPPPPPLPTAQQPSSAAAASSSSARKVPSPARGSAAAKSSLVWSSSQGATSAQGFELQSFSSLQAAQLADQPPEDDVASEDDDEDDDDGTVSNVATPRLTPAKAPSISGVRSSPLPAGYESDVASQGSGSSATSSLSVLIHPQHVHARDTVQAVLAHDWYEAPNDAPTWLVLCKWKHKPVAECSWEPIDCDFLTGFGKMRPLNTYINRITDAHTRECLRKNKKP